MIGKERFHIWQKRKPRYSREGVYKLLRKNSAKKRLERLKKNHHRNTWFAVTFLHRRTSQLRLPLFLADWSHYEYLAQKRASKQARHACSGRTQGTCRLPLGCPRFRHFFQPHLSPTNTNEKEILHLTPHTPFQ